MLFNLKGELGSPFLICKYSMKKSHGFTLVELVTVIILIGILAVSVLPKFDGTASYEAHTQRAQLISALRLTQQRAMQQTDSGDNYCHQLIFDNTNSRYGVPNRIDCTITVFPNNWEPDATGLVVEGVTFSIDGQANNIAVTFNSMGRPINNPSPALPNNCKDGCIINVQSSIDPDPLQIKIESEGYVHAN